MEQKSQKLGLEGIFRAMNIKKFSVLVFLSALLVFRVEVVFAASKEKVNPVLEAWSHESVFRDKATEQVLKMKVTYFSAEYVEALISDEAERNLWTRDEMENYKYALLKNLNMAESIPFKVEMQVQGMPMYAGPFEKHIAMRVGKKKYEPTDYDRRFNFKIIGARDGMVFFPRYDPDTGKEILEGAKDVRIAFDSSVSHAASTHAGDILWVWDLAKDRGKISGGKAANRLEADRLIKRADKLKNEREELQRKLAELNKEYNDVNSRIDELQSE